MVLLGGEAGLRLGEMVALEWGDVDLGKRRLMRATVRMGGQVTSPKGGRLTLRADDPGSRMRSGVIDICVERG